MASVSVRRLETVWPDVNDGYRHEEVYTARTARARDKAGATVLAYYISNHLSTGNAEQWAQRIACGHVLVNGAPATAEQDLRHGDVLSYVRPPWSEPDSPSYVDIVFEDEHMVVLNKPAGLQVLPAAMVNQRTVLALLQQCYQSSSDAAQHPSATCQQSQQPQPQQQPQQQPGRAGLPGGMEGSTGLQESVTESHLSVPAPVHRLGRGTSGLLLCAVSDAARRKLSDAMTHTTQLDVQQSAAGTDGPASAACSQQGESTTSAVLLPPPWPGACAEQGCCLLPAVEVPTLPVGAVRKLYRTRVQGFVSQPQGEVTVPIGLVDYPGVRGGLWVACPPSSGRKGKPSRSVWSVAYWDESNDTTLVNVEIFTGRPHQIRIHMAAMGHPLVGDPLYTVGGVPGMAVGRLPDGGTGGDECAGNPQEGVSLCGMGSGGVTVKAAGLEGPAGRAAAERQSLLEQSAVQSQAARAEGGQVVATDSAAGANTRHCTAEQPRSPGLHGGDIKAGVMPGDCGYALHCWKLLLHHPVLPDTVVSLVAPPPDDLMSPDELAGVSK